ncbi:MAG: cytochrome c oxidase assembly protein [Candidatus Wenzhouxiangella sp. M2_3B_020]
MSDATPADLHPAGKTAAYALIAVVGAALWAGSTYAPATLPFFLPYEFSWPIFLATTLGGYWFARGLRTLPSDARPALWRRIAFFAGLGLLYTVTQTQFEYLAQRMFFINRLQHVVMHHIGAMLVALSWAGPVILAGGPDWLRRIASGRPIRVVMAVLQQPAIAAVLFVGLFYFWLIPPVHFQAMLDPVLYQVMNWSMVVDGVLFWTLVLDPRPKPPARVQYGIRAALAIGVMFPQIALGALITFAERDLFPYYAFCGRFFPSISAVTDQQIGGLVIWIPPAMMSVVALLIVVGNMMRAQQEAEPFRR